MTENRLIQQGRISHFISQFFRYTVILILLTIIGVGTYGFGVLLGLIFFKFIQKLIPFNLSVYNDIIRLTQKKIEVSDFKNQFGKKLIYNFLIFIFILSLAGGIPYLDSSEDKILFSILSGIFILFLLFQFYYFIVVNNYFKLHNNYFSQNHISTNEKFVDENEKEKTSNIYGNKVKSSTMSTFYLNKNRIKLNWIKSLSHNEVVIISIIIGTITFLILGYSFGDSHIFKESYQTGTRFDRVTRSNVPQYSVNQIKIFNFNYVLGITGFILSSGISYLVLNSKRK